MIDFMEVMRRTESGPFISERDFDIEAIFKTTSRLVKKYGVKYNRKELITLEPEMVDGAFQAGLELAETAGIFCLNTSRQIMFTHEELQLALRTAPRALHIGHGKDQRLIQAAEWGVRRKPFIWAGFSGAPLTEEMYKNSIRSYIKEPLVDALGHGSLFCIDGIEVRSDSPLEVRATRQELMYLREALAREGRPGMPYIGGESSTTGLGDLATMNPEYLPPGQFHFVPTLNELKINYRNLARVMGALEYDVYNINLVDALIGGYAGGAEGAAVVTIAAFILGLLVTRASVSLCHPAHNKWVSTSPPESIWAENIVGQAFARNAPLIIIGDVWTSAGTGTWDILQEIAAISITKALTGNNPHGVGATNGKYPHGSGLDARWMAETALAAYDNRLSLKRGNEIVSALVDRYVDKFPNPDLGKPYDQVYDVEAVMPKRWWLEMYEENKQEFAREFELGM
ncbi:MAG TPA: monomethylamine:corrinoid methyltransferase [Anaerolineales bacterium]|nr:monomethylamine:corrinoid methyltransferase [Anaerolineales bacterium]